METAVEFKNPLGGSLEEYMMELFKFLREWRLLIDMTSITCSKVGSSEKAAHFISRNHWERRIPDATWREFLLHPIVQSPNCEDSFFKFLIDVQCGKWQSFQHNAPSSFISFIKRAIELSPQVGHSTENEPEPETGNRRNWDEGPLRRPQGAEDIAMGLMSQKKKMEIRYLGNCVVELANKNKCDSVVDVGAGKGYLTQWLQINGGNKLKVIAVEGSEKFAESFRQRAEILQLMVERTETKSKANTNTRNSPSVESTNSASSLKIQKKTENETDIHQRNQSNSVQSNEKSKIVQMKATNETTHFETANSASSLKNQKKTENETDIHQRNQSNLGQPNAIVVAARVPLGVDSNKFLKSLKLNENQRILLTGLHTCGDLAPTIMKLFLNSSEAKSLAIVGCCYQMLSEAPISHSPSISTTNPATSTTNPAVADIEYGFPLSSMLKTSMDFYLDTGKHLASNVLPQFISLEEFRHSMLMQSYRSAIEDFLNKKCNHINIEEPFPHHVGNMRSRYAGMTFGVYAVRAIKQILRKLPSYTQVPESYKIALKETFANADLSKETNDCPLAIEANEFYKQLNPTGSGILPKIACFAALRNLIGPLIEALIVTDRVLFIKEKAGNSLSELKVIRLFSPDISPRSFALIASKKSN